jgi:sialidase-1
MGYIKIQSIFLSIVFFLLTGLSLAADQVARRSEPKFSAEILGQYILCKQPGRYIGWPTICKTKQGELLVVFSGDRDAHVCPWGKTQMVRSSDNGQTWSAPVTINSTPLDDRDAGIIQTQKGTLVVSWFTSVKFMEQKDKPNKTPDWLKHCEKISADTQNQWLRNWIRRSEDGGQTWGEPVHIDATTPHGPIELRDGRLLFVGVHKTKVSEYREATDGNIVLESTDDGKTWRQIAGIPVAGDEQQKYFHEPHVVECADGKLVAVYRYQPEDKSQHVMRQSESTDGGRTWTTLRSTGIYGYPPHLIRLKNNWLLVVYGVRRELYGEYACLSRDNGQTWDIENLIMIHPGTSHDLGYPASIQFDDGSIYTVYYQIDQPGEKTCLMATHWRIPDALMNRKP